MILVPAWTSLPKLVLIKYIHSRCWPLFLPRLTGVLDFGTEAPYFLLSSFYLSGETPHLRFQRMLKVCFPTLPPPFFFTRNPAVNVSITRVVIAVTSAVLDSIRNLGEQALFWPKLNVKVCSRQANTMCKSSFSWGTGDVNTCWFQVNSYVKFICILSKTVAVSSLALLF